MKKTLTLMRHAKASFRVPGHSDLERTLTEEGHKRTELVVEFLRKRDYRPDIIISSHAVRAVETAAIMGRALNPERVEMRIDRRIYRRDSGDFYDLLFGLPAEASHIMIVGHNPDISDFASRFFGHDFDDLPTSGIVGIEFDVQTWEDVPLAAHKLLFYTTPRLLRTVF